MEKSFCFVQTYTVSAVRLMRIEFGGAFADLLNEKGKGSGSNEMSYVERTIGFRTRDLDDRDLRLVSACPRPHSVQNSKNCGFLKVSYLAKHLGY